MRIVILLILISFSVENTFSQTYSGSFTVGGTSANYYPVLFSVSGVGGNSSLGKLSVYINWVHTNGNWSGSFHSDIEFISSNWGSINTKIGQITYITGGGSPYNDPIGDIADGSLASPNTSEMVMWLKGGATYLWSTTNNSQVVLVDGNSGGTTKTSASGTALNIITTQSQLVLNAKNNKYFRDLGLGTAGGGYFGGNVGIGTTNTNGLLTVASESGLGSLAALGQSFLTVNPKQLIIGNYPNSNYFILQGVQQGIAFNQSLVFQPNGGNVIIGQTSQANSSYRLDVAGNIRANKLVVNTTGADFVFAKKYHLIPLNELEKYIQQNKHLPGIETAKEMTKVGVDVANYETKLLQKIEELTLYLINQQKQIDELKKENSEIRKKFTKNKTCDIKQ